MVNIDPVTRCFPCFETFCTFLQLRPPIMRLRYAPPHVCHACVEIVSGVSGKSIKNCHVNVVTWWAIGHNWSGIITYDTSEWRHWLPKSRQPAPTRSPLRANWCGWSPVVVCHVSQRFLFAGLKITLPMVKVFIPLSSSCSVHANKINTVQNNHWFTYANAVQLIDHAACSFEESACCRCWVWSPALYILSCSFVSKEISLYKLQNGSLQQKCYACDNYNYNVK